MRAFVYFLCFTGICILQLQHIAADCNVCAVESGHACVSATQYKACTDQTPSGAIFNCGDNQQCSIKGICEPISTVPASCADCNTCGEDKVFACTSKRTFALCLGDDEPSPVTGTCQEGSVCNVYNAEICGKEAEGVTATCAGELTTTTTTVAPVTEAPAADPDAYCEAIQTAGRYPAGADPNTTCHQYIQCIPVGTGWVGALYYCPKQTYFDSAKKTCGTAVPPRCSGNVQSLSLYEIQLV